MAYTEDSIKRFERIVAILIQLQSKKIVRAQEFAERFEVSVRTIYRDIRSLEAAGVPIYSEAGVGYSLVDGYKLPPVMFTHEEAGTFVAAERLMQKFMDESLGKHFQSAMFKIKSVLKEEQKERLEAIRSNLLVSSPSDRMFNQNVPDALEILLEAVAEKRQVMLQYQSIEATEPGERFVEPVGVFHENRNWYLFAFCHLRNDYRQFRADRIFGIGRTGLQFNRAHENLDHYLNRERQVIKKTVRLSVEKEKARFVKWDRKHFGFVSERQAGHKIEMLFECDYENNGFARWFMMFADFVDILEPAALADQVRDLLSKAGNRVEAVKTGAE
ncbi:hypothetical protein GCM10023091_27350 [Ravibacter arvi]|uniref:HTH deoR-type domain-containing protein n=1 Tax=Ravibacter arvi TaxID=2051041 RepID=A0ABP8M3F7_9BACT